MNPLLNRKDKTVGHITGLNHRGSSGTAFISYGIEDHTQSTGYHWEAPKRSTEKFYPMVIFQYTLSGEGSVDYRGERFQVTKDMGFLIHLPSQHSHCLPPNSKHWQFAWLSTNHSFIVERLSSIFAYGLPLFHLGESNPVIILFEKILEEASRTQSPDLYEIESDYLRFAIALDKHSHNCRYPADPRELLLTDSREYVVANITSQIGVNELAQHHNMSRSNFSHKFIAATGLAPSAFILNVKLEIAIEQLRETGSTLKAIAAATGFTDANHLCKCFRRRFQLSPGDFRNQVSPKMFPKKIRNGS